MSLSQIGKSITESVTLKLNETAANMRAKGEPVIHLGGGEPKSKAPIEALIEAAACLNSGEVRYTPAAGIPAMKQAIIRYTHEFYDRHVQPEHVIASGGAKQAIMVALQAILNPQEEVLFPAPYWVSYPQMVKMCGAVPVPVYAENGSFHPRLQDLEAKVSQYTRCIIINSPNNPTGAAYDAEFIRDIVRFCEKRDIWLIMDDIYHRLIFDGRQPVNCYKYAKDLSETSKLIVVNGVSKMFAMTGYRIGWAVGNKKVIEIMTNLQSHQTSGPSVVLQRAAIAAINSAQASVESLRATLENNRNVLMDRLRTCEGVHVSKPDGTFYAFADFRKYEKDATKLANFLLDKAKVVTVPGEDFGMPGHLRISFCGTIKEITEGVERIKWALDPHAPQELVVGDRKLVRDWM